MKIKKGANWVKYFLLVFLLFTLITSVYGGTDYNAEVDYNDDYDLDGTDDDGIGWINDYLTVKLIYETYSKDVVCYDWENDGTWNICYGCSSTDMSNCRASSSTLDSQCSGSTTCTNSGCDSRYILPDYYIHQEGVKSKYYSGCTGVEDEYYYWLPTEAPDHTIVNRKTTFCQSDGSNTFYLKGRYSTTPDYQTIDTHTCPTGKVCDDDHDQSNADTETYNLVEQNNPCRTTTGSTIYNQCNNSADCYNDASCGGGGPRYTSTCDYDGSTGYNVEVNSYQNTCGSSGWKYDTADDDYSCPSGYDCDDYLTTSQNPCRKEIGESCTYDTDCWGYYDEGYSCNNGYCSSCGDGFCDANSGESYSTCPDDCCIYDCTGDTGSESSDGVCHSICEGHNLCDFYSSLTEDACNGEDKSDYVCVDDDTYVLCCEGTAHDCSSSQYCSAGDCLSCNTQCNDNCQSSACYGDDPDCDSNGDVNGNCGDGICCQEDEYSCPQDCGYPPSPDLCNGTIEVVVEDSLGAPLNALTVKINGSVDGSSDGLGRKIIDIENSVCGSEINVSIECSDNTTYCDSSLESISVNDETDYLLFACDICKTGNDLYIYQEDIVLDAASNRINVTVHSRGITKDNVAIWIYTQDETGGFDEILNGYVNVVSGQSSTISIDFGPSNTFTDDEYLHVYIDSSNIADEDDEENNYLFRAISKQINASIIVLMDSQYSILTEKIENYLKSFVYPVDDPAKADVVIVVSPYYISNESFWLNDESNKIILDGITLHKPYAGVVTAHPFWNSSVSSGYQPTIVVSGNRIEGTIAAVKRLVNARDYFLNKDLLTETKQSIIDDVDTLGISVFDQLHTPESQEYFYDNSQILANKVWKILTDNNFEVAIKPVVTSSNTSYGYNTTLRVKNVNSDYSNDYKDAVNNNSKPVVFSGGIFSHLETWEEKSFFGILGDPGLAKQMADEGRDVWEIEMTGGPETECDNCPDYTYDDLVDYYWPALIAGIMNYTGKEKIDYVAHSNGCRVALSSLNKYSKYGKSQAGYVFDYDTGGYLPTSLNATAVDIFVGVACPVTLNDGSIFVDSARIKNLFGDYVGDAVLAKIDKTHITMWDFAWRAIIEPVGPSIDALKPSMVLLASIIVGNNKISKNLIEFYKDLALNKTSTFELSDLEVDEIHLFYARTIIFDSNADILVPSTDMVYILNSSNVQYEFNQTYFGLVNHGDIYKKDYVQSAIKEALKNE